MQRPWALMAAFGSAVYFVGLYLVMRVPLLERIAREARYEKEDPRRVLFRIGSLFADHVGREIYRPELHGWEWLPRLTVLVACVFFIYHAARRSTTVGRAAAFGAGAVLLAAGAGDVAGIVIALARGDFPVWAELVTLRSNWTSDALFFGLFSAPFVALYPVVALILNRRLGSPERDPGRSSGRLATAGIVPVVALAFLGGAQLGNFPTGNDRSLLEEIGAYTLYLRLRPTPPPDRSWGYGEVQPLKDWLPQTIFALVFAGILWLVLRWLITERATWLMVWMAVVFASAVAGCVDVLTASTAPAAIRFGVLFGWLPAVAVVIFRRLNRTTPHTPDQTPADIAPDSSATPTEIPTDSPRD